MRSGGKGCSWRIRCSFVLSYATIFWCFFLTLDTLCNQRKPFESGLVLLKIYVLRLVNYKFTCLDVDGEDGNGLQLRKKNWANF